jgi:hypothetical protein
MDEEILLGAYQVLYSLQAPRRRYHIVLSGKAGPCDVENPFHAFLFSHKDKKNIEITPVTDVVLYP